MSTDVATEVGSRRPRGRLPHACGWPPSSGSATTPSPSRSTCPTTCARPSRSAPASTSRCASSRDGGEERRSYSICAPAGAAAAGRGAPGRHRAVLRVAGRPAVQPGDEIEVAPPAGSFTPDLEPGTHHGLIAAGSGITPVLSIAASRARRPRRHPRHPALRQPAHRHRDVHRGARRPEERLRPAAAPAARALPRADGGRDLLRPARRATSCATLLDALVDAAGRRPVVALRPARHDRGRGRGARRARRGAQAGAPRAVLRRRAAARAAPARTSRVVDGATQRGHRRARTAGRPR